MGARARWTTIVALAAALTVAAAGCEDTTGGRRVGGPGIDVVATTPVLADLARGVVGGEATVRSLIPPGADPHEFVIPEIELPVVEEADLLVVNGGGLEADLVTLLDRASAADVEVLVAMTNVDDPVRTPDGAPDPHFWHDPDQAAEVVVELGERLAEVDRPREADYRREARRFAAELRALAGDMEETLGPVPEARRGLVTQHDFFRTFARRFGFTVVASVIPGFSSQGQASASSRLAVIETVRGRGVCALFAPESSDDALLRAVAEEADAGAEVVRVFADTLVGADQTYEEAMRENALRVARALTTCG